METHDELTDTGVIRIQRADSAARDEFIAHFIRTTAAASLLTVAGCATLERHPIASAVVAGVIVATVAAQSHRSPAPGQDVTTQPVICAGGSCK